MNLKGIAYKLQKALCLRGRYIRINKIQFYSSERQKMSTKFILKERRVVDDDGEEKDFTLLETFRMIDIVNFLADELGGGE
ncbi:MAG: hypothetical protein IJD78_04300 [Clostridia bacterium]|nr:hypothetical protein [Clostridia bacterium]